MFMVSLISLLFHFYVANYCLFHFVFTICSDFGGFNNIRLFTLMTFFDKVLWVYFIMEALLIMGVVDVAFKTSFEVHIVVCSESMLQLPYVSVL